MFHPYILRDGRGFPRSRSEHFFKKGRRVFPTGITRVTVDHEPSPLYISRGEGAYLIDVDGNRLLDLNNNFTTLIHGHGFLPVADAVADLLHRGTCFSNPTEHEITLAELLIERIPAIEHIRFVSSGTEAVMFAIKAARAFTCSSPASHGLKAPITALTTGRKRGRRCRLLYGTIPRCLRPYRPIAECPVR